MNRGLRTTTGPRAIRPTYPPVQPIWIAAAISRNMLETKRETNSVAAPTSISNSPMPSVNGGVVATNAEPQRTLWPLWLLLLVLLLLVILEIRRRMRAIPRRRHVR